NTSNLVRAGGSESHSGFPPEPAQNAASHGFPGDVVPAVKTHFNLLPSAPVASQRKDAVILRDQSRYFPPYRLRKNSDAVSLRRYNQQPALAFLHKLILRGSNQLDEHFDPPVDLQLSKQLQLNHKAFTKGLLHAPFPSFSFEVVLRRVPPRHEYKRKHEDTHCSVQDSHRHLEAYISKLPRT
ncbi:hypothetical protein BDN72DRAFT_939819, partial [Pluteus cervinus]